MGNEGGHLVVKGGEDPTIKESKVRLGGAVNGGEGDKRVYI